MRFIVRNVILDLMPDLDVIYLDFDGVLHPADVYRYRDKPTIRLKSPGHFLFESCEVLERLLEPYPSVRIVLSTSWVRTFEYDLSREQLPEGLRARVIGATWHSKLPNAKIFTDLSRYVQIRDDVRRRQPRTWLAIDDDGDGWLAEEAAHLVLTRPELGLSDPHAQAHLKERLSLHFGGSAPDRSF
jgi:hypothetical protein